MYTQEQARDERVKKPTHPPSVVMQETLSSSLFRPSFHSHKRDSGGRRVLAKKKNFLPCTHVCGQTRIARGRRCVLYYRAISLFSSPSSAHVAMPTYVRRGGEEEERTGEHFFCAPGSRALQYRIERRGGRLFITVSASKSSSSSSFLGTRGIPITS